MMLLITTIVFNISSYFFIGPNNTYSVLLPDYVELIQVDSLENNIVSHTFLGSNSVKDFDFSLSISIVNTEIKDLFSEATIKEYEIDCKCKVIQEKHISLNGFEGVNYTIVRDVDGIIIKGEVYISQELNGKSMNIVSLVAESDFDKLEQELTVILDTIVLNI